MTIEHRLDPGTPYITASVATDSDTVFGVWYNSWDKTRHVGPYVPYNTNSTGFLCGATPRNFAATRSFEHLCGGCMAALVAKSLIE